LARIGSAPLPVRVDPLPFTRAESVRGDVHLSVPEHAAERAGWSAEEIPSDNKIFRTMECVACRRVHLVNTDNAPYFVAFVPSSWKSNAQPLPR
jgi:hypothetical protein